MKQGRGAVATPMAGAESETLVVVEDQQSFKPFAISSYLLVSKNFINICLF